MKRGRAQDDHGNCEIWHRTRQSTGPHYVGARHKSPTAIAWGMPQVPLSWQEVWLRLHGTSMRGVQRAGTRDDLFTPGCHRRCISSTNLASGMTWNPLQWQEESCGCHRNADGMILITQNGSRSDNEPTNTVWGMTKHEAHPFSHHNKKHCGKQGKTDADSSPKIGLSRSFSKSN
jgi:hypothetical protein